MLISFSESDERIVQERLEQGKTSSLALFEVKNKIKKIPQTLKFA